MHEIFTKDAEDKEQAVGTVGNDEVRKEGMCSTTAVTDTAKNGDLMPDTLSTLEVNETALVIAVNLEFSRGITDRTGLKFRSYKGHELLKQRF